MSPPKPASATRPANRWASRCSITTTTAGPICSSPTTRSPTSSIAICRTARFKEEGLPAGVAFGEDGVARGAMGVDAADYDRSGRQHLIVGNFSNQMLGLYHNEGNGLFVDEAPRSPYRPRQPAQPDLRPVLLRLRSGRLPRYFRRQRPYRRGDRPRSAEGSISRTPAAVSQCRAAANSKP